MISVFIREQRRYARNELASLLELSDAEADRVLNRLKACGVIKTVRAGDAARELDELEYDGDISPDAEGICVFTFVGVIIVEGRVLKCYPKYLPDDTEPTSELGLILKVLEKYNSREQTVRIYSDESDEPAFNRLSVMLFLLRDYFEHGVYTNSQNVIEQNGTGDIYWDKTISETVTLLSSGRPYYPELLTRKRVNDDGDYFKRLHECILTRCTRELIDAGLLELFDMTGADISDEEIEDLGDREYILGRIAAELNVQFNTRKQLVLKTLYAYIENRSFACDLRSFSIFGTNSFNLVWESVCAEVLENRLMTPLGGLPLPDSLRGEYRERSGERLIDLIDKPKWAGKTPEGESFLKQAEDTLIPDIVSIVNSDGVCRFIISDAKYYTIQLEKDKKLRGVPGIESVTKQYLYQLAFQPFVEAHGIDSVINCFLMPGASESFEAAGSVSLDMMSRLGLQDIQVRLLPAKRMYRHYLESTRVDIEVLKL